MTETVIVIPCYNEAKRLDVARFRSYASAADDVAFLFVDDGSTDDTGAILAALAESDAGSFRRLALPRNCGKAEAVRMGMLEAGRARPSYMGFWDADLSTGLDEIAGFREVLAERPDVQMVIGARVNLLGRSIRRRPARHVLGRVFATVASFALGLPVYDTQCGAKLLRSNDEMLALFSEPFLSRWIFDVEVLARLIASRRAGDLAPARDVVYEKPLARWHDVAGSKIRLRDWVTAMVDLARIYYKYLR